MTSHDSGSKPSLVLSSPVVFVVIIVITVLLLKEHSDDPVPADNDPAQVQQESSSDEDISSQPEQTVPEASPLPATVPDEFLAKVGPETFESPAGLIYRSGSADGHRVKHVMTHAVDQPDKPVHGVFIGSQDEIFRLIDEAWETAQERGPPEVEKSSERGRVVYTVNMKRKIGYVGGESGARKGHPACQKLRLVLEGKNVITAYPMQ